MSQDLTEELVKSKSPQRPLPLNLKGESQEYSKHLLSVLSRNNLKIYNEQKKNTLFEALSEGLFLKPTRGDTLMDLCKKYIAVHVSKNTLPGQLDFLYGLSNFAHHYELHGHQSCFEPVTLQVISYLFEMGVVLHSIFDKNNVLFSSMFNDGFSRKCQFVAFQVAGETSYGAVFEINQNPVYNTTVGKEAQLQEVPLIRKATAVSNVEEETLKNETILEKRLKEYEDAHRSLVKGSAASERETTDSECFNAYSYVKAISKHLNSVAQIEVNLQKIKENEVVSAKQANVTSVQKQLHSVLQLYTNSVSKSELVDRKFHFTDEFNISGVDREIKAQIVFGDKSSHLMVNSVPPGLNKFKFTSNDKVSMPKITSTPDIAQIADPNESAKKKKDIEIIEYKKDYKFKGKLKFYNEEKKYGFITVQEAGQDPYDVFVYDDALRDANLSLQELKEVKARGRKILVTFCKYVYVATNKKPSTKAVDIEVTSNSLN